MHSSLTMKRLTCCSSGVKAPLLTSVYMLPRPNKNKIKIKNGHCTQLGVARSSKLHFDVGYCRISRCLFSVPLKEK